VRGRGRVSSLLEIGIGFNPELTGRENIFLNGAILGMRKAEIKSHFDNIVEFAGVERYIDTPVKRYSSGMYVRLAFAVAAHLESEILIVDEVLAVGDSEFQKKCLGKMGDISKGEGRTVLFVSHTMSAIKQLCNRAILLNRGMLELDGDSRSVISHYLANGLAGDAGEIALPLNEAAELSFTRISVMSSKGGQNVIRNDDDFVITAMFTVSCQVEDVEISFCLENASGVKVLFTSLSDTRQGAMLSLKPGGYTVSATVGGNFLLPETYRISIYAHQRNIRNIDYREQVIRVTIVDLGSYMAPYGSAASDLCCALKECSWELLKT
jgi:lipopolysaccharide transport system ATP-binding protein